MFEQLELSNITHEQIDEVEPDESSELNSLKEEVSSLKTQLAYSLADFDNYKKRVAKDAAIVASNAKEDFANDIFSVIDNFTMAIDTMKSTSSSGNDGVVDGMKMIMNQLESALEKHGFNKIVVEAGDMFDVSKCEAVSSQESDCCTNTIVHVCSLGWTHAGRLVKPAKVVVAK